MNPILWPSEKLVPNSRAILLISDFWGPKFSDGHKIRPLRARDLILFFKWQSLTLFLCHVFLNPISGQKYDQNVFQLKIPIFENISIYDR